ncbi:CATRA conflict system CASPASE/TPR repeat-associated protein [Herbidospora sp. RD11066]
MSDRTLVDQELVVHLYAPADGPLAADALTHLGEVWARCRDLLGMTVPIAGIGLPAVFPQVLPLRAGETPFAAQEHPTADFQMIARRLHDVINVSVVFAAPPEASTRRLRSGSASPNGWAEFDRWWDEMTTGLTGALLGSARIYQAKTGADAAPTDAIRLALPVVPRSRWWMDRSRSHGDFTVWDLSPENGTERRLVIVAPEDQDAELNAWTWSRGDVRLTPLARYLMHTAKVAYQHRVWNADLYVDERRRALDDQADRLAALLADPAAHPAAIAGEARLLRLEESSVRILTTRIEEMRQSVRIARQNMTAALPEPFAADVVLADRLAAHLDDAGAYLDLCLRRASEVRDLADTLPSSPPGETPVRSGPVLLRLGFSVDIVSYSSRGAPEQVILQERLASMLGTVLGDLGLTLQQTEHDGTGDGVNVFLPADIQLHLVFPRLLASWRDRLSEDNGGHGDRMRLRMAVGIGPTGVSALGFAGKTIVDIHRLVDSDVLREAAKNHQAADLVVLVTDQVHGYVVGEGYPGLDPAAFSRVEAVTKDRTAVAWLWVAA